MFFLCDFSIDIVALVSLQQRQYRQQRYQRYSIDSSATTKFETLDAYISGYSASIQMIIRAKLSLYTHLIRQRSRRVSLSAPLLFNCSATTANIALQGRKWHFSVPFLNGLEIKLIQTLNATYKQYNYLAKRIFILTESIYLMFN